MNFTAREPLVIRGAIVAAITALIHLAVVVGWLPIDHDAETAVAGAVDLLGTAVLVVWSRGKVTPAAPKVPAEPDEPIGDTAEVSEKDEGLGV